MHDNRVTRSPVKEGDSEPFGTHASGGIGDQKEAVSPLQVSDGHFRGVFEQLGDAVILFDLPGCVILEANPAAERFYGYCRHELVGVSVEELIDGTAAGGLAEVIATIRETGGFRLSFATCQRKNSKPICVTLQGQVMTLSGVDVVYCVIRDITEQTTMQQEMSEFQSKLISANKLASFETFISAIVHEINNPNNFIMINSTLLSTLWDRSFPLIAQYAEDDEHFEISGMNINQLKETVPNLFEGLKKGSRRIKNIADYLKCVVKNERGAAGCQHDITVDLRDVLG